MIQVGALDQFRNVGQLLSAVLEATFPGHEDTPSQLFQLRACLPVTTAISIELGLPEWRPSAGCRGVETASVPVPEAAMHEDD